uniref:AC5 n=1 Tax=Tomato yellow leaf curl Thailand virus TaxID=85752 RepID=A0A1P8PFW6_9GEMI|nr:AC5 [Tomato yellow leaf curl Thailand virus]
MSKPNTTGNVRQTDYLAHMTNVVLRIERLHFTWTLTSLRDIRTSIHSVKPRLSVCRSVLPYLPFCDADSGDSSTAVVWAVEVQTATYFRDGRGNENICWTLRHSSSHELHR